MSTVVATCISNPSGSFAKMQTREVQLVSDHGVVGDRHAGRDPDRAVLITTDTSYRFIQDAGLELPLGSLAENIVLQIDPAHLVPGAALQLGEEAVVEITMLAPRCRRMREVHPDLLKIMSEHRGVYAKVTRDGIVRPGDPIMVLASSQYKSFASRV